MFLRIKSAPGDAETKIVPSEARESLPADRRDLETNEPASQEQVLSICRKVPQRAGLEEFATAERESWFPSARCTKSGNLVVVSLRYTTERKTTKGTTNKTETARGRVGRRVIRSC